VEAIQHGGLRLLMGGREETIRLEASTDMSAVRGADLVLFCVKSTDTEATAKALAPLLRPDAVVLSLQNGVDNTEVLARVIEQQVVAVAVYVAVAMPEPGVVQHFGRGDLVIGSFRPRDAASAAGQRRLAQVVEHFAAAQVKVSVSSEVMRELWEKLVVNCAFNAISGIAQLPYGVMAASADIRKLQRTAVDEVVAVARAEGHALDAAAGMAAVDRIAASMPGQFSSTAQDLARGKHSEIDHLNGFVARRGEALGMATPANQALHALVKLIEQARDAGAAARGS
jgi:2-dehydropantoate 2-reductase